MPFSARRSTTFLLAVALAAIPLPRLHAQFAEGITTAVAIDQVKRGLDDVLASATQSADYVVAGAAVNMLSAISAWEHANANLLDRAFAGVDEASRNLLADADRFARSSNELIVENLTRAQEITDQINQVAESTILSGRRSYILRQRPVVVRPNTVDTVVVRLNGVNLDEADPSVALEDGPVERSLLGPQDVLFHVPLAALPADSTRLVLHRLVVNHRTRAGRKWLFWQRWADVERDITLATLPRHVGTFTLTGTREFQERVMRTYTDARPELRGTNRNILDWARPLSGWEWDLSRGAAGFQLTGNGGAAGRCQHMVMSEASGHGVRYQVRVDRIREGPSPRYPMGRWTDGRIRCNVTGTIFRMEQRTADVPEQRGTIAWTSDLLVPLPEDTKRFELRVTTFDGRERIITNTANDKYFDVIREPGRLIVRPKVPADIIG